MFQTIQSMGYLIFQISHFKYLESLKVHLQIIQSKKVENFVRLNRKGILLDFFTLSEGSILV